jgi:hypothetical protein
MTLLAVVTLMGRSLAESVLDGSRRVAEQRKQLDYEMNSARWLREAFLSAEVSNSEDGRFAGDSIQVAFRTWLQSAGGWEEPARVQLGVQQGLLVLQGPRTVTLGAASRLEVDYLAEPGADGAWLRGWLSGTGTPYAVRLRIQRPTSGGIDTLLFPVRGRG